MHKMFTSEVHASATPIFRPFNKGVEKWLTYIQQMELHFVAHGVEDLKLKRACLLSWIGAETFELLQKLCDNDLNGKSFSDLIDKLNKHFVEKQHILAARFKFYSIRMKPSQVHADWVAELRGLRRSVHFNVPSKAAANRS